MAVDQIYFRKPASVSSAVMTLRPGSGLISFEADNEYKNMTYEVLGYDPAALKAVSGSADAKTDGLSDVLGGAGEYYINDPACTSASYAANRAKSLARQALQKSQHGRISCIGLPELIPGRFIEIERVDSLVNKKHYITRVTHTFDENGFRTDVDTEGWE